MTVLMNMFPKQQTSLKNHCYFFGFAEKSKDLSLACVRIIFELSYKVIPEMMHI